MNRINSASNLRKIFIFNKNRKKGNYVNNNNANKRRNNKSQKDKMSSHLLFMNEFDFNNNSVEFPLEDSSTHKPISFFPQKERRYIVLDTETTGLDPRYCHLVAINAVEVINCQLTGIQYNAYIKPRFNPALGKVNNNFLYYIEDYANERVNNEKEALKDFLRFVGDSTIITHNARFDITFINKSLRENGLDEIDLSKCVCSLQISRRKKYKNEFGKNSNIRVEGLCQMYNVHIKEGDFHHGIVDAVALARVLCKMWEDTTYRDNSNDNEKIIRQRIIVKAKSKENINEEKIKKQVVSTNKSFIGNNKRCNITPTVISTKINKKREVKPFPDNSKENQPVITEKKQESQEDNKEEIKESRYYLRERKIVNYVESDEGDSNKRTKNKVNDENYLPKDKKEKSNKKPNKSILDRQDLFFKMKKCLEKQKISSNN